MTLKTSFSILLTIVLTSCATTYLLPPRPISNQESRRKAIEQHFRNETKVKQEYVPIGFSKVELTTSENYQLLDSLNDLKGTDGAPKDIDERIARQRKITFADTNNFVYSEEHIYAIVKGKTANVIVIEVKTNQNYSVIDTRRIDKFVLPESKLEVYKSFSLNRSFLKPGYQASPVEIQFMEYFRGLIPEEDPDKQTLLKVLDVLEACRSIQSCETAAIVEKKIFDDNESSSTPPCQQPEILLIQEDFDTTTEETKGYRVNFQCKYKKDGLSYTRSMVYELNPFFEIIRKAQV